MMDITPPAAVGNDTQDVTDPVVTPCIVPTAPQTNDDEVIAHLASLKPLEYERVRIEQAKNMGCRPAVLDTLVKAARDEDSETAILPFLEVDPHPEPIVPALLLTEIADTIRRFIVLDAEQADAVALWVAFTWFTDVVEVAPLAIINAPEKACGKSQLLDLMGRMVARPISAANSSTAFLFRAVELWTPTILIDEADTFIRENDELKGLINAGYTRANAYVGRIVGNDHEPKLFRVWGAKALAGIALDKHLQDATMSRAIVIELRRKLPHEQVSKLRDAEEGLFEAIASKLARFSDDYAQQVRLARPSLPGELTDREQDNWQPLLAIAECAGHDWVQRGTAAALKLSSSNNKSASIGNVLLADIQQVFEMKRIQKISTVDLIAALVADEENTWATYNRGKPLTPRQLSKHLSVYGISSKTVRMGPNNTPKGFDAAQFKDAFARYLSDPQQRNDSAKANKDEAGGVADETQHSSNDAAECVADNPQLNPAIPPAATPEAAPVLDCGGVADISDDAESTCAPGMTPLIHPEDLF